MSAIEISKRLLFHEIIYFSKINLSFKQTPIAIIDNKIVP